MELWDRANIACSYGVNLSPRFLLVRTLSETVSDDRRHITDSRHTVH